MSLEILPSISLYSPQICLVLECFCLRYSTTPGCDIIRSVRSGYVSLERDVLLLSKSCHSPIALSQGNGRSSRMRAGTGLGEYGEFTLQNVNSC
jgi:hypothetical protein